MKFKKQKEKIKKKIINKFREEVFCFFEFLSWLGKVVIYYIDW